MTVSDVVGSAHPLAAGTYRLICPIKDYDWGSIDALPRMFGWPVDGLPHAEMWIGAHPSAPSVAVDANGRHVPLDALLEPEPELMDGAARAGGAVPRLPFLMKGDPAVIVSLLLNAVTLMPGEALFVPPNTLHSYVRGVGVEVMATSDNVLRAGLTGKPVHVDRVLDSADYMPAPPRIVRPRPVSRDELVLDPGVREFRMSVLRCESLTGRLWDGRQPRTVLCLSGSFSMTGTGAEVTVRPGDAAFIAPRSEAVRVLGRGR